MSDFNVHQVGLYLQDQWTPVSRLTLTAGLRFDVPFLPTPSAESGAALVRRWASTPR